MATIIIKNSTGSNSVPASLLQGELAVNTVTGKLFYGSGSGNAVREYSASFSTTALTSSYPLSVINVDSIQFGGALYSTYPISGVPSGRSATGSIWLGKSAGENATNAFISIFIGPNAGALAFSGSEMVAVGPNAGFSASYANQSTFIGGGAGSRMWSGSESTVIGVAAGQSANNANKSVMIGVSAGGYATNAAKSILIGYQAGYDPNSGTDSIGPNNIIIGSYLTLPSGSQDSINIGGIIFGTGSYSTETLSTGSLTGKIGINVVSPNYTLDVSGSGNYSEGLNVSGSLDVSGSGNYSEGLTVTGSINMIGTGSIELSGSLIVSGGFFVHGQGSSADALAILVDDLNRALYDTIGGYSIDWENRILYANDGTTPHINWSNPLYMNLPSIAQSPITNVLGIDGSGNVFYTASSAIGGGGSSNFNSTSSVIGDGTNTSYNINHGFNTRNLHITVYESSSNGETVYPDIRRINANTASIIFANPPTSNQYIVYISQ
jgi:hypothetical protein